MIAIWLFKQNIYEVYEYRIKNKNILTIQNKFNYPIKMRYFLLYCFFFECWPVINN
jgi:hypothetical protein